MNSLSELNTYGLTAVEYTDQRPSTVIFTTGLFPDREIEITSGTYVVQPTFDILEIVNYTTANVRYRITIVAQDASFLTSSYITWPSLPTGVTSSGASGVYTLTGLKTKIHWDAVKNATWTLNPSYSSFTNFYIKVAVLYFDQALNTTVTKEIDIFDKDFYPLAKLSSVSSMTVNENYIFRPVINLSSQSILFVESIKLFGTNISSTSSLSITAQRIKGVLASIQSAGSFTADVTRIAQNLVGIVEYSATDVDFYAYNATNTNYDYIASLTPPSVSGQANKITGLQFSRTTDLLFVQVDLRRLYIYRKNILLNNEFDLVYTLPETTHGFRFDVSPNGLVLVVIGINNYFNTSAVYYLSSGSGNTVILTPVTAAHSGGIITSNILIATQNEADVILLTKLSSSAPSVTELIQRQSSNPADPTNYYRQRPYSTDGAAPPPLFNPDVQPTNVTGIDWSPAGSTNASTCAISGQNITNIYNWNNSGTNSRLTFIVQLPNGGTPLWSPSGEWLAIVGGSNGVQIYRRAGSTNTYTLTFNNGANQGTTYDASWNNTSTKLIVITSSEGTCEFIKGVGASFTKDTSTNLPSGVYNNDLNTTVYPKFVAWRKI